MQISLLLMQEIVKLFVIMLMGYAVVKAGLMKASDSRSISVVLVYLVIPCVIIHAFQVDCTPDVQRGLILAAIAAAAIHILFLAITVPLKKLLQLDVIEQATCIYSNAGILVIPLVQALLGEEYVIYSSAFIAVQLILLWTHGKNLLCGESQLEWKRVLLNVNILSILAGICLFLLQIKLPAGVQDVLGMMNNMIGPLGMLLAGMAIAEVGLSAQTELSDGSAPAHRLSPARAASDQGNFSGIQCRNQRCGFHSSDRVSGSYHSRLCDHHLDGTAL